MTEPTMDTLAEDLLLYGGWKRKGAGWYIADRRECKSDPNPISLDWLSRWIWPKLGEPTISIELLPIGYILGVQFEAELNWADASRRSKAGWGATRAEAAARATWAAIQEAKHD